MGKKHKAPSGRHAKFAAGFYSRTRNLYVWPFCGHPITPGEECRRCKMINRAHTWLNQATKEAQG